MTLVYNVQYYVCYYMTAATFCDWARGTPRKIGYGCAAHLPKPLPYLSPKFAIFPTLFMT